MNEAIADGLRRRQNMLSDFNKAQDLLKGKINEITNERDDFEQKYLNRDSRPEDTEMIDHLNVSHYKCYFVCYLYSLKSIILLQTPSIMK